jgi:hypothetical protein
MTNNCLKKNLPRLQLTQQYEKRCKQTKIQRQNKKINPKQTLHKTLGVLSKKREALAREHQTQTTKPQ